MMKRDFLLGRPVEPGYIGCYVTNNLTPVEIAEAEEAFRRGPLPSWPPKEPLAERIQPQNTDPS